jgi:hypothetical protein
MVNICLAYVMAPLLNRNADLSDHHHRIFDNAETKLCCSLVPAFLASAALLFAVLCRPLFSTWRAARQVWLRCCARPGRFRPLPAVERSRDQDFERNLRHRDLRKDLSARRRRGLDHGLVLLDERLEAREARDSYDLR